MKDTNPKMLFMYIKNKKDKTVSRMGIKKAEVNERIAWLLIFWDLGKMLLIQGAFFLKK